MGEAERLVKFMAENYSSEKRSGYVLAQLGNVTWLNGLAYPVYSFYWGDDPKTIYTIVATAPPLVSKTEPREFVTPYIATSGNMVQYPHDLGDDWITKASK